MKISKEPHKEIPEAQPQQQPPDMNKVVTLTYGELMLLLQATGQQAQAQMILQKVQAQATA